MYYDNEVQGKDIHLDRLTENTGHKRGKKVAVGKGCPQSGLGPNCGTGSNFIWPAASIKKCITRGPPAFCSE